MLRALLLLALAGLVGRAAAGGTVCVSSGDTHMYPFSSLSNYDIYSPRPFVLTEYRSNDKDRRFQVHATQAYGAWGGRTVDNDLAVRCGRDVVVFKQKRNGAVPTIILNGERRTIGSGGRIHFPSAPSHAKSRYYVYAAFNHAWHTFSIMCNPRGYEKDYAFGMRTNVQWFRPWYHWWYRRHGATRYVHANVQIEVQSRFGGHFDRGACGWTRDGAQPRHRSHFISYRSSLFGITRAEHAKAAKKGMKVANPRKLRQAAARCARAIYKTTGITLAKAIKYFGKLDKDAVKTVKGFLHGCAIDLYFGVGHSMDDMTASVCSWVSLASDSVYQDSVRLAHKIRKCEKPYTDPKKLEPLLQEKFKLAQFCNRNPPKTRDPLPKGRGFSPTCEQLDKRRAALGKLSKEQRAKAGALSKKAQEQKEKAEAEARQKAGQRAQLEEEAKKIEKEKQETQALELKAREDLTKREAQQAAGIKAAEPKNDGAKPGSKMVQQSRVFISDATGVADKKTADETSTAASSEEDAVESESADEQSSDDGSVPDGGPTSDEGSDDEDEGSDDEEESSGATPV